MFKSQKNAFWEALLVTILIFGLGVFFGVILENWRVGNVDLLVQKAELSLLDLQVQDKLYTEQTYDCDTATEEIMKFADKIFEEAKVLDRYESSMRLTENIRIQHTKYDLLRALLLINSINVRETCNSTYQELVYFYLYNKDDVGIKTKQNVFSRLLREIKEEKGSEVLLIPIAADNDLSSVNLIMTRYGIDINDVPVIVINSKFRVYDIQDIGEVLKYFD